MNINCIFSTIKAILHHSDVNNSRPLTGGDKNDSTYPLNLYYIYNDDHSKQQIQCEYVPVLTTLNYVFNLKGPVCKI